MKKILLFFLIALILIIFLEGALRLFHFHEVVHFMPDPDLPFVMIPNQRAFTEIGRYPVTINSRSMREREISPEKFPSTYRLIFLGDSITYGEGIPQEDLFTVHLEEILNKDVGKEVRYEVWNAGVKGYNVEHEYMFFKKRCLDLRPDLVLVGYCVNDQCPNESMKQKRQSFSLKYNVTGPWKHIKESATYVAGLRLLRTTAMAIKDLPPWYYDFITQNELTPELRKNWETSALSLTRFSDLCMDNGIRFGIVAFPIEPQFREGYDPDRPQPQTRLKQLSSKLGILYIDLFDSFQKHRNQKIFSDEIHLTPYGHELTAREVAREIIQWKAVQKESDFNKR